MGELKRVNGASWDVEMGAITHMLTEHSTARRPRFCSTIFPDTRQATAPSTDIFPRCGASH